VLEHAVRVDEILQVVGVQMGGFDASL
jgi:hypothetical protein